VDYKLNLRQQQHMHEDVAELELHQALWDIGFDKGPYVDGYTFYVF